VPPSSRSPGSSTSSPRSLDLLSVNTMPLIAAVLALGLLIYLFVALVNPERFE
jgi:K+-transporting ATPase KdpF subunit